jgi:hypothetical protein
MDAHRKIQCAELLRHCLQALANTPHLKSFRYGQTTLHMQVQLRRGSDTVSYWREAQSFHKGDLDAKGPNVLPTQSHSYHKTRCLTRYDR